ncbi:uncharacterized protein NEMAJ01_1843 [Nematocida major]|uniref:uncharacterized protein n=1 Tax=Nematocida major TaxID=1912982 RepID=UPI0020083C13|nr:uncharacterized protein NEMAJ01_1843 [Nematocida major]KAH9386947.1 hypothetical protein NEMAJ01_1843 [Nematocida major]
MHSPKLFEDVFAGWAPMGDIISEGLSEKDLLVICSAISETLSEHGIISRGDSITDDLEDFLYDVLEEFGVSVAEDILGELLQKILHAHNGAVRGRST